MGMQYEDGFHFHTLPSLSGQTKSLILIFHGNRSHPDGYLKWAEQTRQENPDADVLVVRGPVPLHISEKQKASWRVPGIDDLYTWYDIDTKKHGQATLLLRHAFNRLTVIKNLNKMIDNQLAKRDLKDENLALIGFSMGGIVALQAAYKRDKPCAAVVCHSGAVLPFTRISKKTPKAPAMLIMGDQDDIFYTTGKKMPQQAHKLIRAFNRIGGGISMHHSRSLKKLKKAGVDVTEKVVKNQRHSITEESWGEASTYVAKKLKPKK